MTERYRNSQLRLLGQCAFAYGAQYIDLLPPAPNPALDGGRNIHAAVLLLVRRIVEGGPIDVHDIAFRTVRGGGQEYADALHVLTRVQEAIGVEFDIDPRAVFVLEERLSMPITLWDGTEVEYFGTPDLAQRIGKGVCRIRDWKSQWSVETEAEFGASRQLQRYALLIHHHYPNLHTFVLEKRFVRWENSYREMTIAVDELTAVRHALIAEIVAEREIRSAGVFEATPGEWCSLCGYHALCPVIRPFLEGDRGIDVPSIEDDDCARSLASDAHALEQAADAVKRKLKRYLGGDHPRGYVPLPGGGFYGYGPRQHREADYHDVVAALREVGVEAPPELARIDLAAYDRMLKRLPESAVQRAEKLMRRWQSPEFRFRRKIDDAPPASVQAQKRGAVLVIPRGFCQCGCGGRTKLARHTDRTVGLVKGEPLRFIHTHHTRGALNYRWNGGRSTADIYVRVRAQGHPAATREGYVREHILVAERALGKHLPKGAEVHHVNGDKQDNAPTNLVICQDHSYHMLIERRTRALRGCGHADWPCCIHCGGHGDPEHLNVMPSGRAYHRECLRDRRRKWERRNKKEAAA